jgi:4-carboxymuconolactone decarboxylase
MSGTPTVGREPPRFKPLGESEMTEAQRKVYKEIVSGPRGGVRGPFNALLRSPELADRAQKFGEYVRFGSSLPERLKEFAILITARHWTAQYEWHSHHAHALKAGLDPRLAADLALGKRPAGMKADEAAVYDFCNELQEKKSVSDSAFKAAVDQFGERGLVDLIGVTGYYTMVSMVLNVDRHPIPGGAPAPLPQLE